MNTAAVILVVLAVIATALDWAQTLAIARNPMIWREINPILGEHPSVRRVHAYFAVCCWLELSGAVALWTLGQIGLLCLVAAALAVTEAYWVRRNWRNGIRI